VTQQKRQFKSGPKTRTFFDRKVRQEGGSRVLSLSKLIPKDWTYVRIRLIRQTADYIQLDVEKLLGGERDEQKNNNSKHGKS